jgi:hypothetical protein
MATSVTEQFSGQVLLPPVACRQHECFATAHACSFRHQADNACSNSPKCESKSRALSRSSSTAILYSFLITVRANALLVARGAKTVAIAVQSPLADRACSDAGRVRVEIDSISAIVPVVLP